MTKRQRLRTLGNLLQLRDLAATARSRQAFQAQHELTAKKEKDKPHERLA